MAGFIKSNATNILLAVSLAINVGLAHKIQLYQRDSLSPGSRLLGTKVDELNGFDPHGNAAVLDLRKSDEPTLIYVFRPSCGWCARNLSNLEALSKASREKKNFRIVGVSLDHDGLSDYVKSSAIDFPVFTDLPKKEISSFGMGGTPQTILISRGVIKQNWSGAYSGKLQDEVSETLGVTLPGLTSAK